MRLEALLRKCLTTRTLWWRGCEISSRNVCCNEWWDDESIHDIEARLGWDAAAGPSSRSRRRMAPCDWSVAGIPGSDWLSLRHSPGPAPAPMAFTTRDGHWGHWAATTGRSGAERSDNTGHCQMSVQRSIMRRSVRMSAPSPGHQQLHYECHYVTQDTRHTPSCAACLLWSK